MAIIWFIFIIFPCYCAVYMYKIMILQKPDLASFHQISHWSFCWNVIDSLFKWSCSIDCQAHIIFFKTKNCSNDDIFISGNDRIGKMLHNICMSAVALSLRWANHGQWASCFSFLFRYKNICCGYSAPQWGASNEYLQHMFSWRNKKNINSFRWKRRKVLMRQHTLQ